MVVDTNRTIQELDKEDWRVAPYGSNLVLKTYSLRKKPLKDFTVEDLRLLIGLNLDILVPMAIMKLGDNILAEGDLYEGDLLHSVLKSDVNYWISHKQQWILVKGLYESRKNLLKSDDIAEQIRKSFVAFDSIKRTGS